MTRVDDDKKCDFIGGDCENEGNGHDLGEHGSNVCNAHKESLENGAETGGDQ